MRLSCPPFESVSFQDADLLSSAFYATTDAHALWAQLRADKPVYYCDPKDGREPFWVVTRHADVSRVLRDYKFFSSRRGTMLCIVDLNMSDIASDQMMPDTDPPRHRKLREPLSRALTPRAVAAQREPIKRIVRTMLEPALDGATFDIAAAALMFPMAFAGTLMGMPEQTWERMSVLTTMTVAYADPDYAVRSAKSTIHQAHHELFEFFRDEVRRRRSLADPGTDLIGILMSMDVDGEPLTDHQIILNCYALLLGANVTTPHATCTLATMMGAHPDQYQDMRDDPDLRHGGVEEALRWSSPVSHFMRYCVQDIELQGQLIRAGQPVSAWLGAADRDERVFTDPYRFDVRRSPNPHVAFGVGPHFCIGAGLARVGLRVFLDELLDRVEHVEPAGEVRHLESNFVAGYKSMPVRFTARADRPAVSAVR